jgi:hypothetical protein
MSSPATAGPTVRAAFTVTALRLTALRTRSRPTISMAKDCRAGLSKALANPSARAMTKTIHSRTVWVMVSTPSTSARSISVDWVASRMRRLPSRSAARPP